MTKKEAKKIAENLDAVEIKTKEEAKKITKENPDTILTIYGIAGNPTFKILKSTKGIYKTGAKFAYYFN